MAVLWDPTEPTRHGQVEQAKAAAPRLGIVLQIHEVRSGSDIDSAFAAMAREGTRAVLVEASAMLASHRARIADLALKANLPTIGWFGDMAHAGLLMSFGPHLKDQYRRAAYFVDRLLKGTRPADLPVEQPTTFELVVNLKAAGALGLTIPQSLRVRADQVIE